MRPLLAVEALPLEEAREAVTVFFDAVFFDVVARPFEELFDAARGADLLDDPRLPDEEERLPEADAERPDEAEDLPPEEEDLDDADFLVAPELEARLPEDELLLEERPDDDARPEDWLRDFFIDVWFYNDD